MKEKEFQFQIILIFGINDPSIHEKQTLCNLRHSPFNHVFQSLHIVTEEKQRVWGQLSSEVPSQ